jgi:hypothetical protein
LNRVRTNEDMNVSCSLLDDKLLHTTPACDMSLNDSATDDDSRLSCRLAIHWWRGRWWAVCKTRQCFEWVLTSSTSVEYSAGAHLRQTVLAWRRMTIGERCYFKRDLYEYLLAMNSNAFNELTALLNGQRNVT